MFRKTKLGVAVAASTLLFGGQVQAQETREVKSLRGENFQLEEVLVTARKKVENLQSVPLAIDAFSAQMLDEKAINTLEGISKYSTSLTFNQGVLPNDTRPVIRGMNISRGRPNVGVLVDGIDISSETLTVAGGGATLNVGLLDLERIEVIKGPQTVTYGRSAFAGAVNYVTKRPVADKGVYGYIEGETDEHGYWQGLGNVSFPITETLAAGITLLKSDFDGHYENPNTGGDLGGVEQDGAAFALNFQGEGDFSAYFRAEYSDDKYTPRAVVGRQSLSNVSEPDDVFLLGTLAEGAQNLAIPGGAFGLPESTQAECDAGKPFSYVATFSQPVCASALVGNVADVKERDIDQSPDPRTGKDFKGTKVENTRLTLELDWQIGDIQVVSLSGYTDNDTSVSEDFDLTNFESEQFETGVPGFGSAQFIPWYIGPSDANYSQYGASTDSQTDFSYDQYSQEFRFNGSVGNLEWMADVLYWKEDMDAVMNQQWWLREGSDVDYTNSTVTVFNIAFLCDVPGDPTTCAGFDGVATGPEPLPIPMNRDTEHWSGALSLVYSFTDALRVTLEGRYVDETIDYESLPLDVQLNGYLGVDYFDPDTLVFGDPVMQKETVEETEFVPRYSVDWQVTDDIFTYASVGKGFKPGGIATTDGNGDIRTGHYKPETLWTYEIGLKTDLLSNRLRLNGAIFYNDYTDQQVPFFVVNSIGVNNVSVTNAGESEVYGGEIEATYRPSANWTFMAGYTHVETEFKDFNITDTGGSPGTYDRVLSGNAEGDYSGKSFANTPEDVAMASIRYDGQFSGGMNYFTELFANYTSKQYLDQGNLSYLGDYTLVDFSAGISNENWQVTAYVDNLTDEDDVQSGLGNVSYGYLAGGAIPPYANNLSLPNPRTFGMRARYMF